MKFNFDEKAAVDTQKKIEGILKQADTFKDKYTEVREKMFKNLSQNGDMIFFKVLMCEGELMNTPETLVHANGTVGYENYRENLRMAMANLGKFRVYSSNTHNKLKAIPQRAREFILKVSTKTPVGVFMPAAHRDKLNTILYGTEDEDILSSMVTYKKGTPLNEEYTEKYRKGVIQCYKEAAQDYINNYSLETGTAKLRLYASLESSYTMYTSGEITDSERDVVQEGVKKAFSRHPLEGLSDEAKLDRFKIIFYKFPVPSLDTQPSIDITINKAAAEDIKKAQEDCTALKELMIVQTIETFYTQMHEGLMKLNSKLSKGGEIGKESEDYLETLLQTFKDMKITLGSNAQLDEMEAAISGTIITDPNSFVLFDETKAKKLVDSTKLAVAVGKYSKEVSDIIEEAKTTNFAYTMKALKF